MMRKRDHVLPAPGVDASGRMLRAPAGGRARPHVEDRLAPPETRGILVKHRRVLEWSRETDGWRPLPNDAVIEDPCFVRPMPIQALLDAASSDDAAEVVAGPRRKR